MKATLLERIIHLLLVCGVYWETGPVFEQPNGDDSKGEEEGVQQQRETVKLVKDRLLLIVGHIWGQTAEYFNVILTGCKVGLENIFLLLLLLLLISTTTLQLDFTKNGSLSYSSTQTYKNGHGYGH